MNDTDAALRKKVFALRRKGWEYASIQKTLGIGYNTDQANRKAIRPRVRAAGHPSTNP